MIWLNPWAWLGLVGVALPIAIHLLGRGHARVFKFPTLRFIDASRLLPTKRSRLQDPLLLAVRVAIVAIAALALAQPLLLTARRRRALDRGLARVVVVDTSTANGNARTSVDSARAIGRRLAAEAQTSIVVETVEPANALAGASAWLTRQERRSEIVIVSDFRRGEIDRADFVSVPPAFGIVLRRVGAVIDSSATVSTRMAVGARVIEARAAPQTNGSDIEWRSASDSSIRAPVTLLAAPGDAAAVAALQAAAATIAVPLPIDTTRAIAILFSSRADRSAIIAKLEPARIGWQIALLAAARRDGLPIGRAGTTTIDGTKQFVIATEAPVSSVAAARLVGLARQTTSAAPTSSELDPETLSDRELSAWERPATEPVSTRRHRPTDENAPSDARWLWAIVLGLLLAEWRLRQPRAAAAATDEARARAA